MDISPIIETSALSRTWAKAPVFEAVDLRVERGDYIAISGASGAGKSTLMRVLGTLDRGYKGRLKLFGTSVESAKDRTLCRLRNSKISFVFQAHQLLPHLSVQENILLPWTYRKSGAPQPSNQDLHTLVQKLGIAAKLQDFPDALSGGQQQRVAIARALLTQPELLLCDELTGNLDRSTADHVMDVIEAYQKARNCAVVIVSHDPHVVARAHTHYMMENGRLELVSEGGAAPRSGQNTSETTGGEA